MKRRFVAIALVVLMAGVAVTGATLAYFSDSDNAKNLFNFTNLDIQISEFPVATETDPVTGLTTFNIRNTEIPTDNVDAVTGAIVNPTITAANYSRYRLQGTEIADPTAPNSDWNRLEMLDEGEEADPTYYRLVSQWEQRKDNTETEVFTEEYNRLYPGAILPKDPWVDNLGDSPVLVRAKVTLSGVKAWMVEAYLYANPANVTTNKADLIEALGTTEEAFEEMKIADIVAAINGHAGADGVWGVISTGIPADFSLDGIFGGNDNDIWQRESADPVLPDLVNDQTTYTYYYLGILQPDAHTPAIFNTITIPTWAQNFMENYAFEISIKAEAIQADGLVTAVPDRATLIAAFANYSEE